MHTTLADSIRVYIIRNKNRKWLRRLVSVLACAVVFFTTYALILPAITLEQEAFCGLEEHTHTEDCYAWQTQQKNLICSADALGIHAHSAECYTADNILICGQADYVAHSHDDSCVDSQGAVVCTLEERSAHVHGESCYAAAETEAPVLHVHSEACNSLQKGDLICTQEEYEGHAHGTACYGAGETLECTLTENHIHGESCYSFPLICNQSTDPHAHDSSCYGTGDLQCTIPEGHSHGESCHESTLICESTEEGHEHGGECYNAETVCTISENHNHDSSCYTSVVICGREEGQTHEHGSECYSSESMLTCTLTEKHVHSSTCYNQVLQCTTEETPGHSHGDDCYNWNSVISCGLEEGQPEPTEATELVLTCTEPVPQVHVHGDSCFETITSENTPICGNTAEDHSHTYSCCELTCTLEEHTHTLACYSDPEADVESSAIWEATFANVTLTGDRYKDVVAIAETQLGYTESTKNYVVWEDNSVHGYTRYGAWYGVPHGDWCGMFVSFCLHYASVDNIPINYGVRPWIEDLTELGLYHSAAEYSPKSGDIIFYDWEGDGLSDHVGIVAEVQEATEHTGARIKAIEGNSSNCVQYVYYDPDDPVILGYSELPEKEEEDLIYYCGLEEHTHSEECSDAEGNLTCLLTEHTHSEECTVEPVTYYCGLDEHAHIETCYDAEGNLSCQLTEHTHTEECTVEPVIYYCGLEEHTHIETCYDAEGNLSCQLTEHTHTEECTKEPVTYICGKDEHTHAGECFDAEGNLVCTKEEHTHTDACMPVTYLCGLEEHTHSDECYDAESSLICGKEEHSHSFDCKYDLSILDELSEDDRERVLRVIRLIEEMPSADEIDAKIAEFEAAGDHEGKETWLTEVYQQISDGYIAYSELGIQLQSYVVNVDKLMELEYIWSANALIEDINSAAPTPTWYTSTKDFIELNLYDYTYGINTKWESNKIYPGFQWNGGAYSNDSGDGDGTDYRYTYTDADDGIPNSITDRYYIDSIDFGNSIITNYQYGGSNYAKSTTATAVGKLYNNSNASSTGKINWLWYDGSDYATTTNRPVGFSTGYQSISRNLGGDGYPQLTDGTSLGYLFGGTSDGYVLKKNSESIDGLFQQDPDSGEYSYNSRTNHAQYTNNFFQLYDDIITPNFITYPFGNFLPLNTISDLTQATQVGAFNYTGGMKAYVEGIISDLNEDLDRDDDGNGTTADYGDTSREQLKVMLQEYRENWNWFPKNNYGTNLTWANLSPAMAIRDYFNGTSSGGNTPSSDVSFVTQTHLDRMYNIDWDVATNFFFGMEMKMNFMQPKDGMTGNDRDGDGDSDYPMVFYFTGDDDVWVYIDDVLFLDLTGIHRHVGGKIDFVNGWVYYYELDVENGGDVSSTPYKQYSFAALMRDAGKTDTEIDNVLKPMDSNGNRPFKDYSTHDFNFYYMERGSGSSVCRLNFNFPLLKKNSISVNKENLAVDGSSTSGETILGNPDYYFNIVNSSNKLFVGPNSVTDVTEYKIMDSTGNYIQENGTDKIYTTDEYGIFTLKAGQTAVFEGIAENEGNYFVQELIRAEDNAQYPTVTVNGTTTRYNNLIDWSHRTYFSDDDNDSYTGPYGSKWYGRSGYDTDSSTNSSFYFKQQNHVEVKNLGKLSISKVLETVTEEDDGKTFVMNVTLDGVPVPVGTAYTVTNADGTTVSPAPTVTTAGQISIQAGQTATIKNIISGTEFEVYEDSGSAEGYIVTYVQENADKPMVSSTSVSGIVRVNTEVKVIVTNAENAVKVQIPVTKTLSNGALDSSTAHTYSFKLTRVDENGTILTGDAAYSETKSVTVTGTETGNTGFELYFHSSQFTDVSEFPVTFYYRIEEVQEGVTGAIADQSVYLAEITVTKDAVGKISAELTSLTKSGEEGSHETAAFVNTLTEDLSISKIVDGSIAAQTGIPFRFSITLTDASGTPRSSQKFDATFYNADGTTVETTLSTDENGAIGLTQFFHGETAVIHGLPLGTKWTVTEVDENGSLDNYLVSWKITKPAVSAGEGETASGDILSGGAEVIFTNTSTYALPETGGMGTTSYTMAGMMLTLFSAAYLLYRFSKRRREAC